MRRAAASGPNTLSASRLCILTTHPIQYMAPWYQMLAELPWLKLHVVFARVPTPMEQGRGFDQAFTWDTPLRDGYDSSVLNVDSSLWAGLLGARAFRKHLKAWRPDAVLVTGWNEPLLVAGALGARSLGLPVLMRGESNDLKRRRGWVRLAQRSVLRLSTAFLQIGQANRRFYLSHGVDPGSVFDGAYFVDSARMMAMASANADQAGVLRQSMGFDEQDFVFTFCGKHVGFKQPQLILEAAAIARGRGLRVKLVFAGTGPLTDILKARAVALGVPTHFTGFLNQGELWKAYLAADAFVLPSNANETWGLVTNEAMLFGLPVLVSSQVGCCEDLVVEGETGFQFEPMPQALAAAMTKLIEDPVRARQMGLAGRLRVQNSFSMAVATRGLQDALQQLSIGDTRRCAASSG